MTALDTKTLDKVKQLKRNSATLESYFAKFEKTTSNSRCDKYGASFTTNDDRFCLFTTRIMFSAYTGYFGNSGCSTFGSVNKELVDKYFPKALEKLKEEIFAEMAAQMKLDAQSLQQTAQEEIEALQDMLNSLEDDSESEAA